jgi:hypothetical protein
MNKAYLFIVAFGLLLFAGCPAEEPEGGAATYCGDGIIQSPNDNGQYEECEEGHLCAGLGKECTINCRCVDVSGEEDQSHLECQQGLCVEVAGGGSNECMANSDCSSTGDLYCGDGLISLELEEECERDSDCTGSEMCDSCKCVSAPELDCDEICGATEGAEVVGYKIESREECAQEVNAYYESEPCYLTCRYSWYYPKENAAGWDSCCCGMVVYHQCSDCPGQNPQCPGGDSCDSSAPDWIYPNYED